MSYVEYTNGMSTPKEHLGSVLRQARKARGLHQQDVASELGVNVKQVGRWENGENAPSSLTLIHMLRFFRQVADTPDLQELAAMIERTDPPGDLDARIAELGRRIRAEPWLADRVERLLSLTSKEWKATIRHLDGDDHQSTA